MTLDVMFPLLGVPLLAVGAVGLAVAARDRVGGDAASLRPDPTATSGRLRRWDGDTWTSEIAEGGPPHSRGRRFRGRFWGRGWLLAVLAAVVVAVAGGTAWTATRSDVVLVSVTVLTQAFVCLAVYRFVARQMGLDEVVTGRAVLAVTAAGAGAAMLVANPLDDLISRLGGLRAGFLFAGPVEELTKLIVPLAVFVLLRHLRTPRAGLALGLASGFGFAVAENALYAVTIPRAQAPDACRALVHTGVAADLGGVLGRVVIAEPLHWLLTGLVVVVVWRQWHLRGVRPTGPVVAVVVFAMGMHSLNDVSTSWGCGTAFHGVRDALQPVFLLGLYLVLRAAARRSLPPSRVGVVSRGWHPRRLPTAPTTDAAESVGSAVSTRA